MSDEDRDKWNRRYAENSHNKNNPVVLLEQWLPEARVGKALDVACGAGRNALLMARAGFEVDAIDISAEGLMQARRDADAAGLEVNWIEHDLDESYRFDSDYDLIVVLWFVNLPLVTRLCDCLAPGGLLVCEEHLVTETEVSGPRTRSFRVLPGELRQAVNGLEILFYEESVTRNNAGEPLASARVVAKKNGDQVSIF